MSKKSQKKSIEKEVGVSPPLVESENDEIINDDLTLPFNQEIIDSLNADRGIPLDILTCLKI